jgi:hypothetical protein
MITLASCTGRAHGSAAVVGLMMCIALSGCSETGDGPDGSTPSDGGSSDVPVGNADADGGAEWDAGNADADGGRADIHSDGAQPDSQDSDAGQDAGRDGGGETGDGADCSRDPVWNPSSLTFSFTSSGGFVPFPPLDAGCNSISMRYDFVSPDRTLAQRGCLYTGAVNRLVYLTEAQYDAIIANISSIATTCSKGCGADYPTVVFTVASSGIQKTYNSNFYAGCTGSTVLPPFVAYETLGALSSLLNATVNAACNRDAGTSDAEANDSGDGNTGSCVALPNEEAGITDAAEGG